MLYRKISTEIEAHLRSGNDKINADILHNVL